MSRLEVGLIANPVAGVGGTVALKGSDGTEIQARARALGGRPRAAERIGRTLRSIGPGIRQIHWLTWGGEMGEEALRQAGCECRVLGHPGQPSGARDTREAARAMIAARADLVLFAGGDGTARDLLDAVGTGVPVLGIPAGVKMHSGVFATTPERAGELLARLVSGGLVSVIERSVKDLDESALRRGELRPRYFGELRVPEPGGFLQHTKERGRENEQLAITEIAAEVEERLATVDCPVILGPGSTLARIKQALGFDGTLLGFDVWHSGRVVGRDVDRAWLLDNLHQGIVVLSFTRSQGFLIGRGNQQLAPELLRRLGRPALWVVGTRTKLNSLEGRPLLMDSDDASLDLEWTGLVEVIAGYEDRLLYRLASHD
jgi:predicted polyphosphate/ATP-dependent NAD kinase